jgi:hypothetical protein
MIHLNEQTGAFEPENIATGLVVVGDLIGSGEAQERDIVGETPNLAARLQGVRPSAYSDKIAGAICDRLVDGESLRAICADPRMLHFSNFADARYEEFGWISPSWAPVKLLTFGCSTAGGWS